MAISYPLTSDEAQFLGLIAKRIFIDSADAIDERIESTGVRKVQIYFMGVPNTTQTIFPGTDLCLFYELVS